MMSSEGQVVIVTGGTRGIGRAIAEKFLQNECSVIIIGTSKNSISNALKYFKNQGYDKIDGYSLNIGNIEQVDKIFKEINSKYPMINVLVNNAGITRDGLFMRMKEDDWDSVINVNLKGAFNCIKNVIRPMMKQRKGTIVNISSVVGLIGNIGQVNYAASKAGLIGLTKSVARELASRGITVNAIAPGYIETEMTNKISDEARKIFLKNIPLGRAGNGNDIASLTFFLASEEARYITGQTLNVDGGMVMN